MGAGAMAGVVTAWLYVKLNIAATRQYLSDGGSLYGQRSMGHQLAVTEPTIFALSSQK